VLVTGVSAGLGVETARALARRGARVVGAARDLAKAERATARVRADAEVGGGSLELVELDLASLASIRACTAALTARDEPFDLVIANSDRHPRRVPLHPDDFAGFREDRPESPAATAITSRPRPILYSVQTLYDTTACCVVGGRGWNSLRENPARANMAWYSSNV
jgi:NAD(P)-dependent dehydrogenase (short-subunit alcohol dehydrogenase family)